MTKLVQALVAAAATDIVSTGPGYRHLGRGEADPIPSYDVIGFVKDCLGRALGTELADVNYDLGAMTVEQLEDIALSWGMQRVPAKEARVGDMLVFSTKMDGALAAIITENPGSNPRWDEGKMTGALRCRGPRPMWLSRETRNGGVAFRAV